MNSSTLPYRPAIMKWHSWNLPNAKINPFSLNLFFLVLWLQQWKINQYTLLWLLQKLRKRVANQIGLFDPIILTSVINFPSPLFSPIFLLASSVSASSASSASSAALSGTHGDHQALYRHVFPFPEGQTSRRASAPRLGTAPFPRASQPSAQLWFYYRTNVSS